MKKLLLFFIFLLPVCAFSQDSGLGNWMMYFGNKKLITNWNLHHEVQYRNYNVVGDLEQLLLRTGIGHNLSENNNNLLLGVGYILSQNYLDGIEGKSDVHEFRVYQQFITKQSFKGIALQHRYRFEQRFVSENVRLRFRYFLGATIPLSQKADSDQMFYLSAYNEIFLNTVSNVFDRNRLYGGLGYKINKDIKIEIGYMNQFLNGRSRDQTTLATFVSF